MVRKKKRVSKPTPSEPKLKITWQKLLALLFNYKKWWAIFTLLASIGIGFAVYVNKDFYFHTEMQILKQSEKIRYNPEALTYYDITEYDAFCHNKKFLLYLKFQNLATRLKVQQACAQINNQFKKLPPYELEQQAKNH